MDKLTSEFDELVKVTQEKLMTFLPHLEKEVYELILSRDTDNDTIESYFMLLLLATHQQPAKDLYITLLEYYKTIDAEEARFYWEEYERYQNWFQNEMRERSADSW